VVLLLGGAAAGLWFYGVNVYEQAGPKTTDGKPHVVMVNKGDTAQEVAVSLKKAGAIQDEFQFRMAMRVLGFVWKPPADDPKRKLHLKPGEYDLPSGASIKEVIDQITAGKVSYYTVVVPEGLTSAMVVDLLQNGEWNNTNPIYAPAKEEVERQRAAYEAMSPEDKPRTFVAKRTRTLKLVGPAPVTPAEGVLLPGDYAVQRGATIESVIDRMEKAQQSLLAQLWPTRQDGLPVKSQEQALILASIVQNEAGNSGEQERVASVFINRLNKPMRLESDPTIVYGISKGYPLGHGITVSERATRTDWNTYQIDGLPKTPICNPGEASIRAVLNPPRTPYYYFVANGTAFHSFSETYAEHLKNEAAWREFEKKRDAGNAPASATPAPAPAKPPAKAPAKADTAKPAAATPNP
ncbi:MAG TPA: endolytic transglycosylase MltG, partial [Hyphomonadaceae bacterium]|nr:endolytic transglycosylase MltG [Hyphomonadaceae bacterium]